MAAEGVEDGGECGAVGRHVDVLGSERPRADLDGAPGGRLGRLGVAARVGESAEIVQDAGHVGVLAAERRLDDRQRTPVQLGGVIEAARVLERDGLRVQYSGDLKIVVAESVLGDRERLPEHAFGVRVTAVDAVHVAEPFEGAHEQSIRVLACLESVRRADCLGKAALRVTVLGALPVRGQGAVSMIARSSIASQPTASPATAIAMPLAPEGSAGAFQVACFHEFDCRLRSL